MDDIAVEEVQKQRVEQFDPQLVENTGFANFMINTRPSSFGDIIGLSILNTSENKDGANGWQKFHHITLPELYYVIGSLVLLRGIWNFYKFEEVYLLSKEVRTLPIYLYEKAFTGLPELGVAAAIATVLFVVMMALISIYVRKVLKW